MARIAQISDCHLFADPAKTGYGQINPKDSLVAVLDAVGLQQPDLVLVTGDISGDHSAESYQHFLDCWANAGIGAVLKVIPGNHDHLQRFHAAFGDACLGIQHPLILDNWLIIGLDSTFEGTLGKVSQKQLDEASAVIAHHQSTQVLCAVHHHPIPMQGWMDSHEWLNRELFLAWLDDHCAVKLVVYGHIHFDKTDKHGNTLCQSVPSTCWQWAMSDDFCIDIQQPGFRLINIAPDGQFDSRVIRINA